MRKIILFLVIAMVALALPAQNKNDQKYLAGAVPVVDGYVQFSKTFKSKLTSAQIFSNLKYYIQHSLVEGPEHLPQARITEADSLNGVIAASMEEYLYFKRTNWQIHRVRFYYQLVCQVTDGGFTLTMRNLRYMYDPEVTAGNMEGVRRAENWITDDAALTKNGTKLARVSGKFRRFTIDRKDEIFDEAGRAGGVAAKRYKIVEIEE